MNQNDTKICPYCSEEIKMQAVKCKHCKSTLDNISHISTEQDDKQNNDSQIISHSTDSEVISNEPLPEQIVRNENKVENSSGAILAIVLGSFGLLLSWAPILTLFLCGAGLILGIKHIKTNRRGLSIAATAICSVALLINVGISVFMLVDFVSSPSTSGSQTTTDQASVGEKKITYNDGSIYVGEVKGELRHGQGTWTHPDGSEYIGEWKDDMFHGQGTFTFPCDLDGFVHVGEFEYGFTNGRGLRTLASGEQIAGIWKEGSFQFRVDGTGSLASSETNKPSCGHDSCAEEGPFLCYGKNNTCPNTTICAYDMFCNSCDPDGDNFEN